MIPAIRVLVVALGLSSGVAGAAPLIADKEVHPAPTATITAAGVASLRAAAARNEIWAQYDLGVALSCGYGMARNRAEAARWFRKAADQGHVRAQSVLGW